MTLVVLQFILVIPVSPYWSSTSAEPYVDAASSTVTANATVYATWEPTEYTITYNLDGGTNTHPATYNIETPTITLLDATKDGSTFGGWYSDSELEVAVTEITLGSTGNVVLYAKWN